MQDRELMQQVLYVLETVGLANWEKRKEQAIEALRSRLAQPEPEPVAWRFYYKNMWSYVDNISDLSRHKFEPLYTAPSQREWQGLETDGESQEIWLKVMEETKDKRHLPVLEFAVAIEAKLKEKNGG